jgi:hypothetical protein
MSAITFITTDYRMCRTWNRRLRVSPPTTQSGNVAEYYNQGSVWDNAPRCPDAPSWSTARSDNYGRLWGWDKSAGNSCAYKNAAGQPAYPSKQ